MLNVQSASRQRDSADYVYTELNHSNLPKQYNMSCRDAVYWH